MHLRDDLDHRSGCRRRGTFQRLADLGGQHQAGLCDLEHRGDHHDEIPELAPGRRTGLAAHNQICPAVQSPHSLIEGLLQGHRTAHPKVT